MNAVDTNVLIYSIDSTEPVKQTKANDLLDQLTVDPTATISLWQVANEFLNCLRGWEGKRRISNVDAKELFADYLATFNVVLPSGREFDRSWQLRDKYSLSHWDSMLLAACKEAGIDLLYSEDMGNGTIYDGVLVVNPFIDPRFNAPTPAPPPAA